ncbi:MAG: hypothetical protein IT285_08835 [Bdellovibrionales bacterium]|nr:hypothetical protein [Bdellovibrionales bacterium]
MNGRRKSGISRATLRAILVLIALQAVLPPARAGDDYFPDPQMDRAMELLRPPKSRCRGEASFAAPRNLFPPGSECHALGKNWEALRPTDRFCERDSDCVLARGTCFEAALSKRAARDPRWSKPPCPDPEGGMCPPSPESRATCLQGCCVAVRSPES